MVSSAVGLLTIVLLARLEAIRKDERARQADLIDDNELVRGPESAQPNERHGGTDQDETGDEAIPERGGREFVTVDELIERVEAEKASLRHVAARTAPLPRAQMPSPPSPHPRGNRR